jgi:hypothetical protein
MTVPFVCRSCSKKAKCPFDLLWRDSRALRAINET